uniref:Cytochrome b n=1 Tax=Hepatozoon canis TaxID=110120 RepID=A0A481SCI1_9APIC|nr:cytochrome B-2 [Hepatozoon canis]
MIVSNYLSINQAKAHLQSYPCPFNLNFFWNFGFLLAIVFILQILTGILLSSFYTPDPSLSFYSVHYIMREINSGYLLRYIHFTGASLVFIFLYCHILWGIVFGSYIYLPLVWISGTLIFIISMAVAFLGYVLPWGQMSYWGATVITNLLSPIPGLVTWVCGGYYVDNPTLKRFFVLHFVLPFSILVIVFVHIFYLHLNGSNNPLGTDTSLKVPFSPNILMSDIKGLWYLLVVLVIQVGFGVHPLSHLDNNCRVDNFITLHQIVQEWYFLSFYSVLKSIPSKPAGMVIMFSFIQSLLVLAESRSFNKSISVKYITRSRSTISFSIVLCYSFYCLFWIRAQLPQPVFAAYGRIFIIYYFISLIILTGHTTPRDSNYDGNRLILR